MNQKTLITVAILAGLGVAGFFVWKKYKQDAPLQNVTTGNQLNTTAVPNSSGASTNGVAEQIRAGTAAFNSIADRLGF